MNRVYVFVEVACLAMCGCGRPQELTSGELAGKWIVTSKSLEKLQGEYPISTHSFNFNSDGTLTYTNIPDLVFSVTIKKAGKPQVLSGTGKWEFRTDGLGHRTVRLRCRSAFTEGYLLRSLYIYDKGRLYFPMGDPDDRNWFEFEKVK